MKGRLVVEQDFHGNFFRASVTYIFAFSSGFLTESCSFWYGLKDLFTLHKLAEKLLLTIKTDGITRGWRDKISMGGYGGKWFNLASYTILQI